MTGTRASCRYYSDTPQSIAHGLNLQKTGRAVIWYSLTWDLEL